MWSSLAIGAELLSPLLVVLIVVAVIIVAATAAVWWLRRRRAEATVVSPSPPPIIFMPSPTDADPLDGILARRVTPRATRQITPRAPVIEIIADEPVAQAPAGGNGHAAAGGQEAGGQEAGGQVTMLRATPASTRIGATKDPALAAAGTLRMLPGRLEFVDGPLTGGDIRFVHSGGDLEQRVTLGRGEGPSFEHVQIASQTVSRMHAAMTYRDGRWLIANLSETNPVRVNGLELTDSATAVPLAEGDLVELGEVVLRFRS